MMKVILSIFGIILFFFIITLCSLDMQDEEKIDDNVKYEIIQKSDLGNIKYSVDIRIYKRVSEDFLRKFAQKIKREAYKTYERIFITYYLPGMTLNAGAWATSHFNPDLEIKILGMTIEQARALFVIKPKKISDEIIGEWINDAASWKITLVKRDNKIMMLTNFKSGYYLEDEMMQSKWEGKLRFEKVEKREDQDTFFYLIEDNDFLNGYVNQDSQNQNFISLLPPSKNIHISTAIPVQLYDPVDLVYKRN